MNPTAHELFKPLLTWLLASYWPKQVSWLSPASEWEGIQSNIAGRCRNECGGIWCHFCNLPQLDNLHAKRLCVSSLGCEILEALVWNASVSPECGTELVLINFWLPLHYLWGQLEPLAQRHDQRTQGKASSRSGKRETVLYRYLLSSSGLQFVPENDLIWFSHSLVSTFKCWELHKSAHSPKAESIYSTTRLLVIIRPPAMIVFALCVLSPASQGKGRVWSVSWCLCITPVFERSGPSVQMEALVRSPSSSHPQLSPVPQGGLPTCVWSLHLFLIRYTSCFPLQITSVWPFEARGAHSGASPPLGGRTQRRINAGPGTSWKQAFRQGILGSCRTAAWSREGDRLQASTPLGPSDSLPCGEGHWPLKGQRRAL